MSYSKNLLACPVCGKSVPIRTDGRTGMHRRKGRGRQPLCPQSHKEHFPQQPPAVEPKYITVSQCQACGAGGVGLNPKYQPKCERCADTGRRWDAGGDMTECECKLQPAAVGECEHRATHPGMLPDQPCHYCDGTATVAAVGREDDNG